MEILTILEQIRNLSGNNLIDYLKKHKNNQLLKDILFYTYNPYYMYKIKEKSLNNINGFGVEIVNEKNFNEYKNILEKLKNLKGVKQDIISSVRKFIEKFNKENQELLKFILFKDLKLGLGIKTINKVWNNLIPTSDSEFKFVVTKMHNYKDNDKKLPFKHNIVSRKFNGVNSSITMINNEIVIFSRTGKRVPEERYNNIKLQLKHKKFEIDKYIYLGEIVYLDENLVDHQHKSIDKNYFNDCKFVIFDRIKKEDFFNQKSSYEKFLENVEKIEEDILDGYSYNDYQSFLIPLGYSKHIFLALQYLLVKDKNSDNDKFKSLLEYSKNQGWEGIIIRNGDKPYEFKRTRNILRVKPRKDDEFEIVDIIEGTGKYENNLGAIVVKYRNNNVNVATGYSDLERKLIWNKRSKILESKEILLKVEYREESKNKKGLYSLIEPSFKGFRNIDKEDINIEDI